MKTLNQYGKNNIEAIKAEIECGASFNGVVYGKKANRNYTKISVFVGGIERTIKEVENVDAEIVKEEVAEYLTVNKAAKKQIWTVNGKQVENYLTYAQMYDRYGMDFE